LITVDAEDFTGAILDSQQTSYSLFDNGTVQELAFQFHPADFPALSVGLPLAPPETVPGGIIQPWGPPGPGPY